MSWNETGPTTLAELRETIRWQPGRAAEILVHRGAPAPDGCENDPLAYDAAWQVRPCWWEIDIQATRDGVLVLNHDAALDRSTTGTGLLRDHSYDELADVRLRDMAGNPTNRPLATLEQLVEMARGRTVLFLDLKQGRESFEPVLRAIRDLGAHTFSVVLTYAIEDTVAVHRIDPDLAVYGRATNEAHMRDLLGCGVPHDRLVAWIHDETPPEVYATLHAEGILTTYGTFLKIDHLPPDAGHAAYHEKLERGADILNTDNAPRAAAALDAL